MHTHSPLNAGKTAGASEDDGTGSIALTAWRKARRLVVCVVGGTLLLLGIALLVLPGPAFIVIPAGLAILALEFRWARRWLRKARSILLQSRDEDADTHPQSRPTQTLRDQRISNSTSHSRTHGRPQD